MPQSQDEMTLIAERIESMELRLECENAKLEKLHAQKLGLMDDLLTGRVRVTLLLASTNNTNRKDSPIGPGT